MPNPTPQQVRLRERFESAIGLAAPVLDAVLAAGDRLSRAVGPDDEYYPVRPPEERLELAPASLRDELTGPSGDAGESDSGGAA